MKEIDTTIPDFLLKKNQGKVKAPRQKGMAKPPEPRVDEAALVLSAMPEEKRAFFEAQIAEGSFRKHWVLDPGTVALAWGRKMEKEEARRVEGRRLSALPKPERPPPGPSFGHSTTFAARPDNPRKAGTGAWKKYEEMLAWKKKNPNGMLSQLLAETSYKEVDYRWDEERGDVKSGTAGGTITLEPRKAKEKKERTTTAKPKSAKTKKPPAVLPPAETLWSSKAKKKKATPAPPPKSAKAEERKAAKKAVREFGRRNIKKVKAKK